MFLEVDGSTHRHNPDSSILHITKDGTETYTPPVPKFGNGIVSHGGLEAAWPAEDEMDEGDICGHEADMWDKMSEEEKRGILGDEEEYYDEEYDYDYDEDM